ncbi:MAG: 5'-nucleotidase C-terminal domain-containing protein [Candidatus Xenobiia bacterium LiM19]
MKPISDLSGLSHGITPYAPLAGGASLEKAEETKASLAGKASSAPLHEESAASQDRAEISTPSEKKEKPAGKDAAVDKGAEAPQQEKVPKEPRQEKPGPTGVETSIERYNEKKDATAQPKQVEMASGGSLMIMDEMTPEAGGSPSQTEEKKSSPPSQTEEKKSSPPSQAKQPSADEMPVSSHAPESGSPQAKAEDDGTISITLLHTNDMHGYVTGKEGGGSFSQIAEKAKGIAKEKDNVLYLDGGDSTEGTHMVNDNKGKPMLEAMDTLDQELMNEKGDDSHKVISTLGNHENFYSAETMKENIRNSKHPVVSCNLRDENGKPLDNTTPYQMVTFKDKNGNMVKAAVVGVTTPEIAKKGGVNVEDPVKAVKAASAQAKEAGADVVMVLSHCGTETDTKIAEKCPDVSVIVGGHSHDRIEKPFQVGNAVIVQAGSNAGDLGELNLKVDVKTKKVLLDKAEHTLHKIDASMPRDPNIEKILQKYDKPEYNEVLGTISEPLPYARGTKGETKLGNAFADKIRNESGSEICFFNKGAIREGLKKGEVTEQQAYSAYHYEDEVVKVDMTGKKMKELMEKSLTCDPLGGTYCTSGMKIEYEGYNGKDGSRIKSIKVERTGPDGKVYYEELKDDRNYSVSTLSWMADTIEKDAAKESRHGGSGEPAFTNRTNIGKARDMFYGMIRDTKRGDDVFNVSTDRISDISKGDPSMKEVVGRTFVPLNDPKDKKETNLGNFLVDTIKSVALATIGLLDKRAVRSGIEMGDITRQDLYEAFPHNDKVVSGDFTGQQIMSMLERGMTKARDTGGNFAISGMQYKYDATAPEGQRIKGVSINGDNLDMGRTYRVGFTDYARDHYEGMNEGQNMIEHGRFRDLLAQSVQKSLDNPALMHVASNRIQDLSGGETAFA